MNNNPLNAYRQTKIKTASQGRLIVMLYDGAIKQLDRTMDEMALETPKLDCINNSIVKTQEIITELMASLDFEKGGEIAKNLYNIYVFFNQQLLQANIEKKTDGLEDIRNMIAELRDVWVSIQDQDGGRESASGINIAG